MVGFAGAIVIELKVTFPTVRSADPNRLPVANDEVAVISVWPAVKPVATPLTGSMLATAIVPACQVTKLVRSADVPSENTPVALNCWVTPIGILALEGDTMTEFKVTFLTVSNAVADLLPSSTVEVAVITVWPAIKPVARPRASMVATVVVPDCQTTEVVISADVPSENTPSALNCCVVPIGMFETAGVTSMDVSVAGPEVPPSLSAHPAIKTTSNANKHPVKLKILFICVTSFNLVVHC
jgi:hypothetical protein